MYKNKVVAIVTDVIPDNCSECICSEGVCNLPMKKYPRNDEIKKAYISKRHKDCPLVLETE